MVNFAKTARLRASPKPKVVPEFIRRYHDTLETAWKNHDWSDVADLADTMRRCWQDRRQVFLCGNGGSAANAIHLANDFLYALADINAAIATMRSGESVHTVVSF